jgi:hypothetical protein
MCTAKNLGDPNLEDWIRRQLGSPLKRYSTIRVRVLGASENDDWEVKVQNAANGKSWRTKTTMNDSKTPENILKLAREGIVFVK